tara:strand:- start:3968 stop:4495 length:528 start_codon:yes stop_codon:yes gene_type:complete
MKKTIYLLLLSFVILYCESPSNNEASNKDKIFGEWLRKGYSWTGNGFTAGDKKDSDIVKKFMDAYENMDPNLMVEMTSDTVKFHPADIAGTFDVDMTNTNFIVERQSGWDSISRNYAYIMPLKIENSKDRVVTTVFSEIRYKKDGSTDSNNFYERIYLNENDKVTRVVQFSRPTN